MTTVDDAENVPPVTTPVGLSVGTGPLDVRGACPRAAGVVAVTAALVAAVVSLGWLAPIATYDLVTYVAAASVGVTVATTGVLLAQDPEQRVTGRILVAVAAVWLVSWSNEWRVGPLPLLAAVVGPLWYVLGAWALLRYPGRALGGRHEAVFLGALGAWSCGGALVLCVLGRPEWSGFAADTVWFTVPGAPGRARWDELATTWFLGLGVGFAVLLGLLVTKLRRSRGLGRRETLPPACAAAGIAVAGLAYVGVNVLDASEPVRDDLLVVVALAVAATPVAFLLVAAQRQAARAAVAELVVRLTRAESGAPAVQEALRAAVDDPGLRLSYWLPAERRYEDVGGEDVGGQDVGGNGEAAAGADRWHAEVRDAEGEPLARVALDPSLRRQPDLVSAALGAAGLALANGRLHHRVQAQLEEVRASRQRIVTATQAERQRFERAVHDGAQGPLVAVSAALSTVRLHVSGQPEVVAAIERAQDTVRTALGDLRDIARGIHPMVLSEEGLRAALARLAEGQSVPTTIDVPTVRLPREIEGAFYYTAAEALTNVVKHAGAGRVHVRVRCVDGFARLRVDDDGCGGARLAGGTGLAGLRDRARALGGELCVGDGESGGTRVVVTIPCA
jgi:signal transduction histidine kinase